MERSAAANALAFQRQQFLDFGTTFQYSLKLAGTVFAEGSHFNYEVAFFLGGFLRTVGKATQAILFILRLLFVGRFLSIGILHEGLFEALELADFDAGIEPRGKNQKRRRHSVAEQSTRGGLSFDSRGRTSLRSGRFRTGGGTTLDLSGEVYTL